MLPLRTEPLDGRVEYFLDAAQDCGELDACSAMTLRLYGGNDDLIPIAGQRADRSQFTLAALREDCFRLAAMADAILPELAPVRRSGLVRYGLRYITHTAVELAETCSNWAVDDEVEGGAMQPFRDRPRQNKRGETFKRTARRLQSPKFIRRSFRSNRDTADHLRALSAVAIRRALALPAPAEPDDTIHLDYIAQLRAHRPVLPARGSKATIRRERKVILRSLRAAISVLGEEPVRAFLRGEEIRMTGQTAMLVVQKRGRLAHTGHGSLSIGLADTTGIKLADLCTYVEDTPTLDQLAAFALWMGAGDDAGVLAAANITTTTEAGQNHPILARRHSDRIDQTANALAQLEPDTRERVLAFLAEPPRKPFRRVLSYEEQRARNDAYWESTKGHWIEAMMVYVIGYRNFPVFKQAGAL